jgi:hypothetical protein
MIGGRGTPVSASGSRAWIIDIASLVVSCVALVFGFIAWSRPLPTDPRDVPSLGQPDAPLLIKTNGAGGQEFFQFLDRNQGRLVRLFVALDEDLRSGVDPVRGDQFTGSGFTVPGPECPNVPLEQMKSGTCDKYHLMLKGAAEGSGLSDSYGWQLRGYFASDGRVDTRQNVITYFVYPVSLAEAVQ